MRNQQNGFLFLLAAILIVSSASCTPPPPQSPAQIKYERHFAKAGVQRFAVVGKGPFYALLAPLGEHRPVYVAEVLMGSSDKDAAAIFVADAEVTGEPVYTLISRPLARSDLEAARGAVMGWDGDLMRGYTRTSVDPVLKQVQMKVVARLMPSSSAPVNFSTGTICPLFFFGNHHELFAVRSTGEGTASLWRVRVRGGLYRQQDAKAVRSGICVTPLAPEEYEPGHSYRADIEKYDAKLVPTIPAATTPIDWDLLQVLTEL